MLQYQILNGLVHFLIFYIGAGIGSFLNVVIHRLPRNLSVNEPRRSFCPSCGHAIPWHQNIPILSWLLLGGRCARCRTAISPRYLGVEIFTGLVFYAVFLRFGGDWAALADWGPQVLCLWILFSLLIAGTFIDLEHFILPHEITVGGTVVGLVCATAVPELVGEVGHGRALLISFGSAALGLGGLWLVVELGKLAFGRKRHRFEPAADWSVTQPNDQEPPIVTLGGEVYGWGDLFMRDSDRLILTCGRLSVNERRWPAATVELGIDKLQVRPADGAAETFELEKVTHLEGTTSEVVIPREAMGFGDVLFLMMIGAFLGWKAVLFTIFAASVLGSLLAGVWRLIGRGEWGARIPFGPYLAAGAGFWVFYGPQCLRWYLGKVLPPP